MTFTFNEVNFLKQDSYTSAANNISDILYDMVCVCACVSVPVRAREKDRD